MEEKEIKIYCQMAEEKIQEIEKKYQEDIANLNDCKPKVYNFSPGLFEKRNSIDLNEVADLADEIVGDKTINNQLNHPTDLVRSHDVKSVRKLLDIWSDVNECDFVDTSHRFPKNKPIKKSNNFINYKKIIKIVKFLESIDSTKEDIANIIGNYVMKKVKERRKEQNDRRKKNNT